MTTVDNLMLKSGAKQKPGFSWYLSYKNAGPGFSVSTQKPYFLLNLCFDCALKEAWVHHKQKLAVICQKN